MLWSAFPDQAAAMERDRSNEAFLPGIAFPDNLVTTADTFSAARARTSWSRSFRPSTSARSRCASRTLSKAISPVVTASKGLEIESFRSPSQILRRILGERSICVLTGPSHAEEVAHDLPASVVAGCEDLEFAAKVQGAFNSDAFRVYTSLDGYGAGRPVPSRTSSPWPRVSATASSWETTRRAPS